jgi:hypothetical protein
VRIFKICEILSSLFCATLNISEYKVSRVQILQVGRSRHYQYLDYFQKLFETLKYYFQFKKKNKIYVARSKQILSRASLPYAFGSGKRSHSRSRKVDDFRCEHDMTQQHVTPYRAYPLSNLESFEEARVSMSRRSSNDVIIKRSKYKCTSITLRAS